MKQQDMLRHRMIVNKLVSLDRRRRYDPRARRPSGRGRYCSRGAFAQNRSSGIAETALATALGRRSDERAVAARRRGMVNADRASAVSSE